MRQKSLSENSPLTAATTSSVGNGNNNNNSNNISINTNMSGNANGLSNHNHTHGHKHNHNHSHSDITTQSMKRYGSASSTNSDHFNSTIRINDIIDEESCLTDDQDSSSIHSSASSSFLNSQQPPQGYRMRYTESNNISMSQKISYYIPFCNWLLEYKPSYLLYDTIAGLTLASYQIPLSMSFATAVAHVPTSSGLLGLSIGPIVYLLMGTVPQMIVGPEAAVSMIIGQNIEKITKHNPTIDPVDILSTLTFLSGLILLIFGILRFGYLDNVLCGTLLRGFITAIGLSMILNSIISILGLSTILENLPPDVHVHSAFDKFKFLLNYYNQYHQPTTIIGFTAFISLLFLTCLKKYLVKKKIKSASFFPEILFIILLFTILSYLFDFESHEIDLVGKVTLDGFKFRNPLSESNRNLWSELFPVAFVCAILGFFETSTAGKSLSSMLEMPVSSNRELVSLGVVGTTVTWFGGLPSFGGYARSRLNAMIGGKTPVSGLIMGLTTLFVTFNLLDYIYYLPLCVLNSVIAIVGYRMVQESPKELKFHYRNKGWNEIITFFVTLFASLYSTIEIGVSMGCFYSLMRVLKHSTQSRVQILSRVAGTDTFVNPDFDDSPSKTFFKLPKKFIVSGYKEFRKQSLIDSSKNLTQAILNDLHISNTLNSNSSKNSLNRDKPLYGSTLNSNSNLNSASNPNPTPLPANPSPLHHPITISTSSNSTSTSSSIINNSQQNIDSKTIDVFPELEDREGCLIVKIPEPLTFFNANDMKGRLKRIELYGSSHKHPGSNKSNKKLRHVVFDLHGMTSIDSSATQILYEIIESYQNRGVNVFFTRLFKSKQLISRFKQSGIENLLSILDGEEFGIKQSIRPYYDDILDALKAIDTIDSSCEWETRSYFSNLCFE